jgi:hypothetical protein
MTGTHLILVGGTLAPPEVGETVQIMFSPLMLSWCRCVHTVSVGHLSDSKTGNFCYALAYYSESCARP